MCRDMVTGNGHWLLQLRGVLRSALDPKLERSEAQKVLRTLKEWLKVLTYLQWFPKRYLSWSFIKKSLINLSGWRLQIDSLLKTKKSMERDVCWSEAKTLYCLKSHRKDLIITTTQSHVSADDWWVLGKFFTHCKSKDWGCWSLCCILPQSQSLRQLCPS